MNIELTDAAVTKALEFLDADNGRESGDVALRVQVQAGGCAGFRYALYFDDRELDGDHVSDHGPLTVRVDEQSGLYLDGAVLDWKESLEQSGFTVDNPNSSGTCACGESESY